jgi:hypothetical protein
MAHKYAKILAAMNGDRFIANDQGEKDVTNPAYMVVLPTYDHIAPVGSALLLPYLARDIEANPDTVTLSDRQKNVVLGGRMGAVLQDLLNPNETAASHHCKRVETCWADVSKVPAVPGDTVLLVCPAVKGPETKTIKEWKTDIADAKVGAPSSSAAPKASPGAVIFYDTPEGWATMKDGDDASGYVVPPTPAWVDDQVVSALIESSANLLCVVAFMFRVRGHHWKQDFADVFALKGRKLQNITGTALTADDWKHYATYGVHAIYPDSLDDFWVNSAMNGSICNSMIIRVDAPAAGTAGFFVLSQGAKEWNNLFKPESPVMQKMIIDLTNVVAQLGASGNRWLGGINHNLYGASGMPGGWKESQFAPLAAAVYGVNTPDAGNTDLGDSKALERIAKGAPLTTKLWRATGEGLDRVMRTVDVQNRIGGKAIDEAMFS